MESNSERYGLFGVTLSLVGWLLCIAVIMVAATVVAAEFDRAPEHWARAFAPGWASSGQRRRREASARPGGAVRDRLGAEPRAGPDAAPGELHPATDDPAGAPAGVRSGPRGRSPCVVGSRIQGRRCCSRTCSTSPGTHWSCRACTRSWGPRPRTGTASASGGTGRRDTGGVPQHRAGVERPQPPGARRRRSGRRGCSRTSGHPRGRPVQQTNCHPFRHGRWLFMHNGYIDGLRTVRRDLAMEVDPVLFPDIEGTTDTELLFFLALTYGLEADPPAAVARAVGFVEATGRRHGVEFPIQMTVVTTDGETTWAFRYSSEGRSRSLFHSADVSTLRAPVPGQPDPPPALRRRPSRRLRAAGGPARSLARGARSPPASRSAAASEELRPVHADRPVAGGLNAGRRRRWCSRRRRRATGPELSRRGSWPSLPRTPPR